MDVIDDLKLRARRLYKAARDGDSLAVRRLRAVPQLSWQTPEALGEALLRRHALAAVAHEVGFHGWQHAVLLFRGERPADDFGTLLYPKQFSAHLNVWSASYDEAREIREARGEYLLAYKRQFFVAGTGFVEAIGLDPGDPDWEKIGRDWARPTDATARRRMYGALVRRWAPS